MPVINPSRTFEGGGMGYEQGGKYIKPEVRQIVFNKNTNKEGIWLFILPAYKEVNGAGAWYKVVDVRDNFGEKFKDKYYVPLQSKDPASYFEKNFKRLYPAESKPVEVEENGRKGKKYPNYGRITKRVVFNTAILGKFDQGVHVLDLPSFNGADQIDKWHKSPGPTGQPRPLVNDPTRCSPIFFKLNDGGGGNPWQINIDPSNAIVLPDELANTDHGYIYNLDDIFVHKTEDEIISKLRESFHPSIFDQCMAGWEGIGDAIPGISFANGGNLANPISQLPPPQPQAPAPAPQAVPFPTNMPKANASAPSAPPASSASTSPAVANMPKAGTKPAAKTDEGPALPANPMAGISKEDAMAFLNS